MKVPCLLLFAFACLCALPILAQSTTTPAPSELDAVVKELETGRYDGIKNKKLDLRAIHYVSGTSRLTPEDKQYLDTVAIFLTRVPTVIMEIGGHTDNVGDKAANLLLSQERATAAMQYVMTRGVLARRIRAVGYGSRQPVASNSTENGRAQNRRIEMTFQGLTTDVYNIVTKSGRKIPATYMVISADGRTISYRADASAPLTRIPTSAIAHIDYPDGSRRRPDAVVIVGGTGSANQKEVVAETAAPEPVRQVSTLPLHPKSIIKYAPLTNFGYEHVLRNNHSIYAGVSLYSLGFGASAIGLKGEYRFYGLIKTSPKQAPEGFWVAPTAQLWRVSGLFDSAYLVQAGGIAGYQWVFSNRITLEPALGLAVTAVGGGFDDDDYLLDAGVLPLFALRVGYVIK